MYRLYIDEVGTDDLTHAHEENNRYLSLTGVAMTLTAARDSLAPALNSIKIDIFDHDPDEPLIFHRTDIVQRKRAFGALNNPETRARFDARVFEIIEGHDYVVISALLDKLGMMNQPHWANQHPYHYLMEIIVEKYTQFLERKNDVGDIMPEGRKGKKDDALQRAFDEVVARGTRYVGSDRMQARLSSKTLKVRYKPNNIAGLQLCDLVAHPSHMFIRERMRHQINMGDFCLRVRRALIASKYDRSERRGQIVGYGCKWLP